jgi:hypothetical protein
MSTHYSCQRVSYQIITTLASPVGDRFLISSFVAPSGFNYILNYYSKFYYGTYQYTFMSLRKEYLLGEHGIVKKPECNLECDACDDKNCSLHFTKIVVYPTVTDFIKDNYPEWYKTCELDFELGDNEYGDLITDEHEDQDRAVHLVEPLNENFIVVLYFPCLRCNDDIFSNTLDGLPYKIEDDNDYYFVGSTKEGLNGYMSEFENENNGVYVFMKRVDGNRFVGVGMGLTAAERDKIINQ